MNNLLSLNRPETKGILSVTVFGEPGPNLKLVYNYFAVNFTVYSSFFDIYAEFIYLFYLFPRYLKIERKLSLPRALYMTCILILTGT